MYLPLSLRSVLKASLVPLLLMSLLMPSSYGGLGYTSIVVTDTVNYFVGDTFSGHCIMDFRVTRLCTFSMSRTTFRDATFDIMIDIPPAPIGLVGRAWTVIDSRILFMGKPGRSVGIDLENIVVSGSKALSTVFLFDMDPDVRTYILIKDVIVKSTGSLTSVFEVKPLDYEVTTITGSTFQIYNVSVKTASNLVIVRDSMYQWDLVGITDCVCENCKDSYVKLENKVIRSNLLLVSNSTQKGNGAILDLPLDVALNENANLFVLNMTSTGTVFKGTPTGSAKITSKSHVTLYNITAPSLFSGSNTRPFFSNVPNGAQVYLGVLTLNKVAYTTEDQYKRLNLPFTRVVDTDRRVLFVRDGEVPGVALADHSAKGQVTASHCVNDGYAGIGYRLNPDTGNLRADCICKGDRQYPYCTPFGIFTDDRACAGGMTLSPTTGYCVWCIVDQCGVCSEDHKCVRCGDGYTVDDQQKCTRSAKHCKVPICGKEELCSECDEHYTLTDGKLCVQTVEQCTKYTEYGVCTACKEPLAPSTNGNKCVNCAAVDDCIACSDDRQCAQCKPKHSLVDGSCVSCDVENCERCEEPDKCKSCAPGYVVTEEKSCAYRIPHCEVYPTQKTCGKCEEGFTVSPDKTTCFPAIEHCVKYYEEGTCKACDGDLSPSQDAAVCVNCSTENCMRCSRKGECTGCSTGYYQYENQCMSCKVPGCYICYKNDICGSCFDESICHVGGEQDTSKGVPWWVWLIVGIGGAVIVGVIIFFIVWCCCVDQKEFNVMYHEGYYVKDTKEEDSNVRKWVANGGGVADNGRMVILILVTSDNAAPRIFTHVENSVHGDSNAFSESEEDISSPDEFTDSDF